MCIRDSYQGEGTPGLLPYLVGVVAARNTIDIVRAAGHLAAAHTSKNYVVWGHSEGGQTAMFGLDIGNSYAPDLDLKGVVAGAPPSQFQDCLLYTSSTEYGARTFPTIARVLPSLWGIGQCNNGWCDDVVLRRVTASPS